MNSIGWLKQLEMTQHLLGWLRAKLKVVAI